MNAPWKQDSREAVIGDSRRAASLVKGVYGAPLPLRGFWAKSAKQRSCRGGVGINVKTKGIREIRHEGRAEMYCRKRS
jgi:hypothetical protein